jgi:glycine/D-amino acid oxidase-like deaminating enzyme
MPAHPVVAEIDVAVVGGGIVGSSVAGFLAAEGLGVAIIDAGVPGGTTANAGSLHVQMQSRFMQLYPDLVAGMESTLHLYAKAVHFWKEFEKKLGTGIDLKITGGLMVAEDQAQLDFLAQKAERERRLGLEVDILDRRELERIAPYLGPAVVGAELCHLEGKLNPLLANAAVRRWLNGLPVALVGPEPVRRIERAGAGFRLSTNRGTIGAGRVVIAAGSGSRAVAGSLGVNLPVSPEPLHMNITEPTGLLIGHLVQHADRPITLKQLGTGQVVIGGGWPARLDEGQTYPRVELASIIGNLTLAQHIVPAVAPLRVIRTWAGINTTGDGRSILGAVAGVPGLFVAIPGDAGYTLGPLCARLVADAVLGRKPEEDIGPYSPTRFAALTPAARA